MSWTSLPKSLARYAPALSGIKADWGIEVPECALEFSEIEVGDSLGVVGEAVVLFQLDGGVEVAQALVHLAEVTVYHPPVVVGSGEAGLQLPYSGAGLSTGRRWAAPTVRH